MIKGDAVKIFSKVMCTTLILFVSLSALSAATKKKNKSSKDSEKEKIVLQTAQDSLSYTIGLSIGKNFMNNNLVINQEIFFQGIKDQYAGMPGLTDEQIQKVMDDFQQKTTAELAEKRAIEGASNLNAGNEFMENIKKDPAYKSFDNGICYKVLTEGTGDFPDSNAVVKCHYRGTTIDGKEFDSSYDRNEPIEIAVNGVILGWQYILPKMRVGSKWNIVIPSNLAYGEQGAGNVIGPYQVLIFDIELISINPPVQEK